MNLLEFEAKSILQGCDIPVPRSYLLDKDSSSAAFVPTVLKSQVPVGQRGKNGGIRIVQDKQDVVRVTQDLLHHNIRGHIPNHILAEELLAIKREFYLSVRVDYNVGSILLLAHHSGGVEIEEHDTGTFLSINLQDVPTSVAGQRLAEYLSCEQLEYVLIDLIASLKTCLIKNDALLIEINPLVITDDDDIVAADCKMTLDASAFSRHSSWNFESSNKDVNFVTLNSEGTVATIANGAGLAMATVDAVADTGMTPANFLDIGGGASEATVLAALKRINKYPNIRAIVVNIFAGITRSDEVARALVAAAQHNKDLPALFVRIDGTNTNAAREILNNNNLQLFTSLDTMLQAVKKEVS